MLNLILNFDEFSLRLPLHQTAALELMLLAFRSPLKLYFFNRHFLLLTPFPLPSYPLFLRLFNHLSPLFVLAKEAGDLCLPELSTKNHLDHFIEFLFILIGEVREVKTSHYPNRNVNRVVDPE